MFHRVRYWSAPGTSTLTSRHMSRLSRHEMPRLLIAGLGLVGIPRAGNSARLGIVLHLHDVCFHSFKK